MKKNKILSAKTQKSLVFKIQGGGNPPPTPPPNDVPANNMQKQ